VGSNDRRNGPQDVDLTLYSLRKWAGLVCKGNPTALHFLFAPGTIDSPLWKMVRAHHETFLARDCAKAFLGFADDQIKRVTGEKGRGQKGQRVDLEEQFGYDVKAAMHSLRLLFECKELMTDHKITLPRPERDLLVEVRTGKWTLDRVVATAKDLALECENAAATATLPEHVDQAAISTLTAECYLKA